MKPQIKKNQEIIDDICRIADHARREGLLACEDGLYNLNSTLLRKGLQLVVDGTDPEYVRKTLTVEVETRADEYTDFNENLKYWGMLPVGFVTVVAYSISMPIVGGVCLALLMACVAVYGRKKRQKRETERTNEIVIEGVIEIQCGTNPRLLQELLEGFLKN